MKNVTEEFWHELEICSFTPNQPIEGKVQKLALWICYVPGKNQEGREEDIYWGSGKNKSIKK